MFEYTKIHFDKYIRDNFDINNEIVLRKVKHSYDTVNMAEYIADDLDLSTEDRELAKVIALLHDIGRFNQSRSFNNLVDADKNIDHAVLGIKILFDNNLIREFVNDSRFDNIIKKAIINHNKYELDDSDLNSRELLHCKLIRDADKAYNFKFKVFSNVKSMAGITDDEIENSSISDKVYNDFMLRKTILNSDRKTAIDIWVSYIAYVFDFNFSSSLRYIRDNNYINILIDRFCYKNSDTKSKIEKIRKLAIDYIDERLESCKDI